MSVTPVAIVEAFSLTHAQILDRTKTFKEEALAQAATPEDLDIYGVNSGSIEPSSDSYINEGDDAELSIWYWLNNAEVSVQQGYFSFPLISKMTGVPVSSSGSGLDIIYEMDLWHEDSFNVGAWPMLMRMPSKDRDGVVRTLTLGLFKVQFSPLTFEGPQYKDGLKINMTGTALMSATDEKGVVFPDGKKRIGKVLSHR